jgi:hypothetical protein
VGRPSGPAGILRSAGLDRVIRSVLNAHMATSGLTYIDCDWVALNGLSITPPGLSKVPLQNLCKLTSISLQQLSKTRVPNLQALCLKPVGTYRTLRSDPNWQRSATFSRMPGSGTWRFNSEHRLTDDLNPNRSYRLWRKHPPAYLVEYSFSGTGLTRTTTGLPRRHQYLTRPNFTIEWVPDSDVLNYEDVRGLALKALGGVIAVATGAAAKTAVTALAGIAVLHGAHSAYIDPTRLGPLAETARAAVQQAESIPPFGESISGLLYLGNAAAKLERADFLQEAAEITWRTQIPWQFPAKQLTDSNQASLVNALNQTQTSLAMFAEPAPEDIKDIYQVLFDEGGFDSALSGELEIELGREIEKTL